MDPALERLAARGLNRRNFLTAAAAAGGGLLIGVGPAPAEPTTPFAPNAFIRIDRQGKVTLVVGPAEMGQGAFTAIPMLIAEELEVELSQVSVEAAPADQRYANPLLGGQITGGSATVRGLYTPMRQAGAAARMLLIEAAAARWGVSPDTCRAQSGHVVGGTGRRLPYGALVDAAARLKAPADPPLKSADEFRVIGTAAKRLDAPTKVNGTAVFGLDARLPGMRFAAVANCPVFGGTLKSVDSAPAMAIRGVSQVAVLDDAVAVVADNSWAARKGLAALTPQWDFGENAALSTQDILQTFRSALERSGKVAQSAGDMSVAAEKTYSADYAMPMLAHLTMEPMNCTVEVRADSCELWVSTQVPGRAQATAAAVTGLPAEKVKVNSLLLGGGYGRRLEFDYVTQAVRFGQLIKGPVKVFWSREEDIQRDAFRYHNQSRLTARLDREGRLLALHHRVAAPSVMETFLPALYKDGVDLDAVGAAIGPYAIANHLVDYVRVDPPKGLPIGNWRGVGATRNVYVVEGFIDELAALAGDDPVTYRRAMMTDNPRAVAVLDLATEKAGWGKPLPPRVGQGVSVFFDFESYLATVAEVEVGDDGAVVLRRIVCALDCGQVINTDTAVAQIEGGVVYGLTPVLHPSITVREGRVQETNFDTCRVIRLPETPPIEVHIVASHAPPGGVGEPGTAGVAPAVLNAIHAATGVRLRDLPIDYAALSLRGA